MGVFFPGLPGPFAPLVLPPPTIISTCLPWFAAVTFLALPLIVTAIRLKLRIYQLFQCKGGSLHKRLGNCLCNLSGDPGTMLKGARVAIPYFPIAFSMVEQHTRH